MDGVGWVSGHAFTFDQVSPILESHACANEWFRQPSTRIKFPDWWEAPDELFRIDGHCGLVAEAEASEQVNAPWLSHAVSDWRVQAAITEFGLTLE